MQKLSLAAVFVCRITLSKPEIPTCRRMWACPFRSAGQCGQPAPPQGASRLTISWSRAMPERADAGEGKVPSAGLWRSLLWQRASCQLPADPLHRHVARAPSTPRLPPSTAATAVAGDFYEFFCSAGRSACCSRCSTSPAGARTRVERPDRRPRPDVPDPRARAFCRQKTSTRATAMIETLPPAMNRTVLSRGGLRSCPAFIGCYNERPGHGLLCQRRSHSGTASRRSGSHSARGHRTAPWSVLAYHAERRDLCPGAGRGSAGGLARYRRSGAQR